jgi:hypothetical protein
MVRYVSIVNEPNKLARQLNIRMVMCGFVERDVHRRKHDDREESTDDENCQNGIADEQLTVETLRPDIVDKQGNEEWHIGHYKNVVGQDVKYHQQSDAYKIGQSITIAVIKQETE